MPFIDRPSFLALLKRLDGADDADVLAAARDIARRMKEGGVAWDDLVVRAAAEPADDEGTNATGARAAPLAEVDRAAARTLIQAVLAHEGLSEQARSEMRDFLDDMDAGRFGAGDWRYVRALATRLGIKMDA